MLQGEHDINISFARKVSSLIFYFYESDNQTKPILMLSEKRIKELFKSLGFFLETVEERKNYFNFRLNNIFNLPKKEFEQIRREFLND